MFENLFMQYMHLRIFIFHKIVMHIEPAINFNINPGVVVYFYYIHVVTIYVV